MAETASTAAPAPTAASAPAAAPGSAPAANSNWYDNFSDIEVKNFATHKQWKDPMEAVRSGMNLEKLIGVPAEQIIKLPKADDAEAMSKVYDRLGRPAKAEDYKLPVLEGNDGAFAKSASEWMHKAGLTTAQAQALAQANNEHITNLQATQAAEYKAKIEADSKLLKTEWGAAHEKNLGIARGAARELGIEASTIDALEKAMGFAGVMRFMHSLGTKIGEDKFVSGNGSPGFNGVMAPAQAQAQLAALRSDPGFVTKYLNKDSEAVAKMERLFKMAYPDG